MGVEEENIQLKQELARIKNIHHAFFTLSAPINPENLPSGPPELVHGYKVGFANGWTAFRRQLKRAVHPEGNN
jgi:hypothetical protein